MNLASFYIKPTGDPRNIEIEPRFFAKEYIYYSSTNASATCAT